MEVCVCTVLVEDPPEYVFDGGLFYVRDTAGVRVMRPHTFFKAFARAALAARQYKCVGAEILEFPGRDLLSS